MAEAGATRYLRKTGWLKLYRSEARLRRARSANSISPASSACRCKPLDTAGAQALEPSLNAGVRACGVLAAGGEREQSAGGDAGLCRALCRARRRHAQRRRALAASRSGKRWRVETDEGGIDARRRRGRARAVGAGRAWSRSG